MTRRAGGSNALLLRFLVHASAFGIAPLAYMQAVIWRIRGLRLRARHRFSTLKGTTSRAYALWIATREPALHAKLLATTPVTPPIDAIVDARGASAQAIDDTVASLLAAGPGDGAQIFVLRDDPGLAVPRPAVAIEAEAGSWPAMAGRAALSIIAGDTVSPTVFAAYRVALAANPGASLFYADDDLLDASGRRSTPHFKPSWNPELFRHLDYLAGSSLHVFDQAPSDIVWPPSPPLAEQEGAAPVHVPYVLHHRRIRPRPALAARPALPEPAPHVSVVVPTRNQAELLRTCLDGLKRTAYPSFDVTVIDNGSDDPGTLTLLLSAQDEGIRIVRDPRPFNYAEMHNDTVSSLAGPLLCFLNNDIEMLAPDWLAAMAPHALEPRIGAVGALLLYPDRSVQHAGIVTGVGGGAAHAHRRATLEAAASGKDPAVARALLPQFVTAVTAACLVVEKAKFQAVGGFDAGRFPVAFNDVDLCLKLNARRWQSFYEPRAVLVHHESKSRGRDLRGTKKRRFAGELAALKQRWHTDRTIDPYHHPELSPFSEQFVVRL